MALISPQQATRPGSDVDVYVGPRPFQTGEKLYARDRECSELVSLLISQRLVLLHSPSGAGKTSLIQADLVPAMRAEEFDVVADNPIGDRPPQSTDVPVIIRVNREAAATDPPGTNRYLLSTLVSLERHRPADRRRQDVQLAGMRLSQYLDEEFPATATATAETEQGKPFRPLLLIFDQFEELLRLDPTDGLEKWDFVKQVGEALRNRRRWALFAMREDFAAALAPYLPALPTQLTATYRLELLRADTARLAIEEPARAAGVEFEPGLVDDILTELRQVRVQQPDGTFLSKAGDYIEPVQLQVICRRLWEKRQDPKCISHEDLKRLGGSPGSSVDAILGGYYAEQVREAAAKSAVSEQRIRTWFGERLIAAERVRLPVLETQAVDFGLNTACLKVLDKAYLIRREDRGGSMWYELAHDRLINPVIADNNVWFDKNLTTWQRQAQLWDSQGRPRYLLRSEIVPEDDMRSATIDIADVTAVERDFLAACKTELDRLAREKERKHQEQQYRRARNKLVIVSGFLILAVATIGLTVWALWRVSTERNAAEAATDDANMARAAAEVAKADADKARAVAEVATAEAGKQSKTEFYT
jgi:hypothetical protein